MSTCAHRFVPVVEVLVNYDAERAEDALVGYRATHETACELCGEPGSNQKEYEPWFIPAKQMDKKKP